MPRRSGICLLLATIICSVVHASAWFGYYVEEQPSPPCYHDHHHHHHFGHEGLRSEEYGGLYERNGCACLLFAESSLVFRSENTSIWHSCSGWGLRRCGYYCDELFQDEGMRFRSRQNACDTIGKEIHIPLYRRYQVCGVYGPYEDILDADDLCCKRGRPSDECSTRARRNENQSMRT